MPLVQLSRMQRMQHDVPSLALKVRGDEGINEALQTYRFLARRT